METPIFDFLTNYANSGTLRMHMPGHKGLAPIESLSSAYELDITEIAGADSLFEAERIIRKSEENASHLFGTLETVYSCGGSTLSIQAMLYLMKQERRTVVAMRTVHRSFLNACILLGLRVVWVYPDEENGILSGEYSPAAFEKCLTALEGERACVYATSPDYTGHMTDIKSLAHVCRKFSAPLLVDNAHGSHLMFTEEKLHPMSLGADLCCDSAHKTLPCLTGCGYLHTSSEKYNGRLKQAMSIFGSTSPSYLMLCSLDLCNDFLENNISGNLRMISDKVNSIKTALKDRYIFRKSEPLHIAIDTAAMGWDGRVLADQLTAIGCYPEYAGREMVLLLLSAAEKQENILRLQDMLTRCEDCPDNKPVQKAPAFPKMQSVMSMREAALSPSRLLPVEEAVGRVCAGVHVPCPPAVPIVISGEVITEQATEILKFYGVDSIETVDI